MQAKKLLEMTSCPEPTFKDWINKGVIVPQRPGGGPGVHAEYDDANAVALSLALRMKEATITVAQYSAAFQDFHAWLRTHSAIEWPRHIAVFKTDAFSVVPANQLARGASICGFVASLAPICEQLTTSTRPRMGHQLSLIGLESVGR